VIHTPAVTLVKNGLLRGYKCAVSGRLFASTTGDIEAHYDAARAWSQAIQQAMDFPLSMSLADKRIRYSFDPAAVDAAASQIIRGS
jgi:hypothetical protein